MSFAIEILQKLEKHKDVDFQRMQQFSLSDLVKSLLERARKKKLGLDFLHEIIGLIISILTGRSNDFAKALSHNGGLLPTVVRCWSEKPDAFEIQLKEILSLARTRRIAPEGKDTFHDLNLSLVSKVVPELRYTLLRLLVLNANDLARDIDLTEDLREIHITWDPYIFESLPSIHASALLDRLSKARPGHDFLSLGSEILSISSNPRSNYLDPQLLSLYLTRGSDAAIEAATSGKSTYLVLCFRLTYSEVVVADKKKAMTSREQTDRAFHAKSAFFYAILSGSLKLVGDVVLWMRRYTRDPVCLY